MSLSERTDDIQYVLAFNQVLKYNSCNFNIVLYIMLKESLVFAVSLVH